MARRTAAPTARGNADGRRTKDQNGRFCFNHPERGGYFAA